MKVLVPTDGSKSAQNAIKHALALAKDHSKMEVTVITIINLSDFHRARDFMSSPENIIAAAKENYLTILDDAEKIFKAEGVPVKTALIESGDAAEAIISTVKQQGFEKVIMGTRGLTGLEGFILGSVVNKVIAHVRVPITLVH